MPLFIFISGLFDHPRDRFPINKVAFYIVLGFLYKLLNFYVGLSLGHYSFLLLGDSGAPWFMFSMAAWVSLTWLLRRFPLWPVLATSLALSLAVGYDSSIGDYLYLSRIITLFPFYWIAYKLHPERVVETVQSRRCFALGVIVLIAWGGRMLCPSRFSPDFTPYVYLEKFICFAGGGCGLFLACRRIRDIRSSDMRAPRSLSQHRTSLLYG